MSLQNKTAVVTGGCGGLGRVTASKLIAEGARVVITDLDDEAGEAVAAEIGCQFIRQDVSQAPDWVRLLDHLRASGGGLQILVNNAAILRAATIEEETLGNFNRVMAVNCGSVFLGISHCLQLMSETGGSIINISSSSALMGFPQFCAYTASKAAVMSLTMSTAVHAKKEGYGVRCNSIHPDGILTPMMIDIDGSAVTMTDSQARHAASFACEPEAVADVVVFLASEASRHINGAALTVDNTSTIYPPYL